MSAAPYRSILCIAVIIASFGVCAWAQHKPDKGFSAFLETMDAAQLELQNGRSKAYKELWSRSSDVTLSGGFGGKIECGWADVEIRLDWVATQFSNGSNRIERLVAASDHDLGYVVQTEHLEFTVPGRNNVSTKDYRVTMVFRKEHGRWKIVHRQADSNLIKEVR